MIKARIINSYKRREPNDAWAACRISPGKLGVFHSLCQTHQDHCHHWDKLDLAQLQCFTAGVSVPAHSLGTLYYL